MALIRFTDLLDVPDPERTKVKFNIRAGNDGTAAWDLLQADDQTEWLNMTRYRTRQINNNLDSADFVMAFA